jgi:hypothetical protein
VGLIPINLHLQKLAAWSLYQIVTLSPTYPLAALVHQPGSKECCNTGTLLPDWATIPAFRSHSPVWLWSVSVAAPFWPWANAQGPQGGGWEIRLQSGMRTRPQASGGGG